MVVNIRDTKTFLENEGERSGRKDQDDSEKTEHFKTEELSLMRIIYHVTAGEDIPGKKEIKFFKLTIFISSNYIFLFFVAA